MHQLLPWLYRAVKVSLQSVWRIWSATMITDQRRQPPSSVPSPSSNCFSRAAVRVLQKQKERIGKTTEDVLQDWVRKRGSIITFKKKNWKGSHTIKEKPSDCIRWRKRKQMKLQRKNTSAAQQYYVNSNWFISQLAITSSGKLPLSVAVRSFNCGSRRGDEIEMVKFDGTSWKLWQRVTKVQPFSVLVGICTVWTCMYCTKNVVQELHMLY